MRDLDSVIKHIIPHIPQNNNDQIRLVEILNAVAKDYKYQPPEAWRDYWDVAGAAINRVIGYPAKEDWHFKVLCIWMDKPLEEVKKI